MKELLLVEKYKTADKEHIYVEISTSVQELLTQTDRKMRSQRRQDRRHHTEYIEGFSDFTIFIPQESIVDLIIKTDNYQKLYSGINKLSQIQRRRIILYYFHGLTYCQVAEFENVSYVAVMKSIAQAIKKLRKIL